MGVRFPSLADWFHGTFAAFGEIMSPLLTVEVSVKRRQSLMNTASLYQSRFFGIMSSRIGWTFDTVEVRDSSPLVPTIIFPDLRKSFPPG